MFKTRQQIADEFGINRKTLERMLKRADITLPSGNVSPKTSKVFMNISVRRPLWCLFMV